MKNSLTIYEELPLSRADTSEFAQEAYNLLPSLADLVDVGRIIENHNRDLINQTNRDAGEQMIILSPKVRPNALALGGVQRCLLLQLDEQEANSILFQTWKTGVKAAHATSSGVEAISIKDAALAEEALSKAGSLLNAEVEATKRVRVEFNELDEADQRQVFFLLISASNSAVEAELIIKESLVAALIMPLSSEDADPPAKKFIDGAKLGLIDDLLFEYLVDRSENTSITSSLRALSSFVVKTLTDVKLLQDAPKELVEEEAVKAMAMNISLLPSTTRQEFYRSRDMLIQRLEGYINDIRKRRDIPAVLPTVPILIKRLEILFENEYYDLFTRGEDKATVARISQKRNINRAKLKALEVESPEAVEVERVRKKAYAARRNGGGYVSQTETPPMIDKKIQEYYDTHKGTPQLVEDLQALIQYILAVDYGTGRTPGIKKTQYELNFDGKPVAVYQLKPGDAVVTKHSKVIYQTRILFIFDDEKNVHVLEILDRDEVSRFERNNKIGSSRRG